MKSLKNWLKEERGRSSSLARHLGLTEGRITQFASDGVPDKYKIAVSDFTHGEVSVQELVAQRTPDLPAPSPATAEEGGHA